MKFKKIIGKLHLWLGFTSGLVVFVSMLAASIFVWEEELMNWYHKDLVFVEEVDKQTLPLSQLWDAAQKALPGKPLTDVNISRDGNKSYVFSNYKKSEKPGITWMSGIEYMDLVFVDQYTGLVLGKIDKRYDWIFMSRMLHQCLLLRQDVGHLIVGISTLIIFVMVITGLILWFPKNKAALKQRFSINWSAKWRRINYDTHSVGGFYMYIFIIFFAATGLVWTFKWWTNGIYTVLGTDPKKVWEKHTPIAIKEIEKPLAVDVAFQDVIQRRSTWTKLGMGIPGSEDSEGSKEINVFLRFDDASGWDVSDGYFYHPETGQLHAAHLQENKTVGAKWRNSNYAMHVGSIYGLPTKILAFVTVLFCASLPVTGVLIWYGRRKKSCKVLLQRSKEGEAIKHNDVLVFKTNFDCDACAQRVGSKLRRLEKNVQWTVDLEHRDKVLKVSATVPSETIKKIIEGEGFLCEEVT